MMLDLGIIFGYKPLYLILQLFLAAVSIDFRKLMMFNAVYTEAFLKQRA